MKNFINRYSMICLIFSITEQLLVAMSTLCMVQIGQTLGQKRELVFWIIIFAILLFIVFLPRYGYQNFLMKAKYRTLQAFIHDFEQSLQDKTYLTKEKDFINQRKPFFYNETWSVVNETYDFILDYILTFLNICFSIGIIAFAIKKEFFITYILAFFIALFFFAVSKKRTEQLSLHAQDAHVAMNNILFYGWDTMLSSNRYNDRLWNIAIKDAVQKAISNGVRKLRYVSGSAGLAMIISSAPVFLLLIWTLLYNDNMGQTASLIVTLPRQVNTIQYLNVFITLLMGWSGIRAKVLGLNNAISVPKELVFKENYIKFDQLAIEKDNTGYHFESFDDLLSWEGLKKPGRITIRGGNGTGKSTLFTGLKTRLKSNAYYFSPDMELYFSHSLNQSLSMGELIFDHLVEIFKHVQVQVLLLDEWDANLDATNLIKINRLIDEMSKNTCVIEIRHRKDA